MNAPAPTIDVLFVSEQPLWPLDQGFKVHGLHMAKALEAIGVRARIVSMTPPRSAPGDVRRLHIDWPASSEETAREWSHATSRGALGALRARLARYWVAEPAQLAGVLNVIDTCNPATVIGVGLHSPVVLRSLRRCRDVPCVWYGADELVRFHASCLRRESLRQWPRRLRHLAQHALMENLFVRGLDGAIGVSPTDARLMRIIAGARRTVTIRNGVDLSHYRPALGEHATERPNSLVFWGRMDFEPNVDAVTWFAHHVWPLIRRQRPTATWRIVGKCPTPRVTALDGRSGITVVGPADDIRSEAWSSQVTILPMRCGGGIKNKLLEAAAMARPIVASPVAVHGLEYDEPATPWRLCDHPDDWARAIIDLWDQPIARLSRGQQARAWVEHHHTWRGAAESLCDWLKDFTTLTIPHADEQRSAGRSSYRRAA